MQTSRMPAISSGVCTLAWYSLAGLLCIASSRCPSSISEGEAPSSTEVDDDEATPYERCPGERSWTGRTVVRVVWPRDMRRNLTLRRERVDWSQRARVGVLGDELPVGQLGGSSGGRRIGNGVQSCCRSSVNLPVTCLGVEEDMSCGAASWIDWTGLDEPLRRDGVSSRKVNHPGSEHAHSSC